MWTFIWSLRDEDTTLPVSCTTNTDNYIRLSDAGAAGNVLCKVACETVFLNSRNQYYRLSATNHWLSIAEKSKQLVNYLRTGNSNLESKIRLSAHEMAYSFLISRLLITDYYKKLTLHIINIAVMLQKIFHTIGLHIQLSTETTGL